MCGMFGITVNVPGYYERLRGVGRVVVEVWKIWIKATGRVRDSVKVRVI